MPPDNWNLYLFSYIKTQIFVTQLNYEKNSEIPSHSTAAAGTASTAGAGPTCHHRFIDFTGSSFLGTYLLTY